MWKEKYRNRFIPSGRIGRKDFLKNELLYVMLFILFAILAIYNSPFSATLKGNTLKYSIQSVSFVSGACFIYCFVIAYLSLCLFAKRIHDIGLRLWWLFIAYIVFQFGVGMLFTQQIAPTIALLVNLGITLVLFLKRGDKTKNKFGDIV